MTLFVSLTLIIGYGQIDKELMDSKWYIGKEKVIYEKPVLRLEGQNNIGGTTNVGFQSFDKVRAATIKKAESEMWTPEKKEKTLSLYERFASGGMIHLYLTRLSIDAANTNMFTLIVKDSTDNKEIFRKDLDSKIANVPNEENYWWNYTSIPIKEKLQNKFYLYIIDKIGGDNNKFKFEIKQ